MKRVFCGLFFILTGWIQSGCYRSDVREIALSMPDIDSAAELREVRQALLDEQDRLQSVSFYSSIRIREHPPTLLITYNSRQLAKQNIKQRLVDMGYRVTEAPGDPVRLQETRLQPAER